MEGFSTPYIYFCLGNFLFVITCLICSMLRWFHVCNEYRHNINFFFPARRVVTLMFGTQVLQSFYWMNVFSDTAFFYAAVFGVVAIPPFFTLMEQRFFFFKPISAKEVVMRLLLPFLLLTFILYCYFTATNIAPFVRPIQAISTILILIEMTVISRGQLRVMRIVRGKAEQEYSNIESFPKVFARSKIGVTIFSCTLLLAVLWAESRYLKLVVDLLMSGMALQLLIPILNTKRSIPLVAGEESKKIDGQEAIEETDQTETYSITAGHVSEKNLLEAKLEQRIIELIEGKELYKEPKLTLADVAKELGKSRNHISGAIGKSKYQSFYSLVNHFRIEHAKQRLLQPEPITLDSLAGEAGFSSRYTLIRVFKDETGMTPTQWKEKNKESDESH